jgi:hypothetical protein
MASGPTTTVRSPAHPIAVNAHNHLAVNRAIREVAAANIDGSGLREDNPMQSGPRRSAFRPLGRANVPWDGDTDPERAGR